MSSAFSTSGPMSTPTSKSLSGPMSNSLVSRRGLAGMSMRPMSLSSAARIGGAAPPRFWGALGLGFGALLLASPVWASSPDYDEVRKDIAAALEAPGSYDDGSFGPLLVRLAWHASGTYDAASGTGGSNGATMRFSEEAGDGANNGLEVARMVLEPIKRKHPGLTYADLWTLAGAVAIEEMGGPHVPWRPGRSDAAGPAHAPPNGRLPDASQGAEHVRAVFGRMGFNDRETVALVGGGHALGRCHRSRSGYHGPWGPSPTFFSNDFFVQLTEKKWVEKKWDGPRQFVDQETGEIMMLPTDMTLLTDPVFEKITREFAADEDKFFEEFAKAFSKLLELGVPFEGSGFFGKAKRLFY